MSSRDRLLLKIVVPLVAVAAFWFILLSPRLGDLHHAGDDLTAARGELATANASLAAERHARVEARAQHRARVAAERAIPSGASTPALLRQLQRTAERAGVELVSVTPSAAAPGPAASGAPTSGAPTTDGVAGAQLSLGYSGSYAASQRFLRGLAGLVRVSGSRVTSTGRLIAVSSVQLAQDAGGKLTGTLTATTYTTSATAPAASSASTTTAAAPTAGGS
ncbi:MAG TPA: hypothetical protein VHB30_13910 [Solirubrobacteraceae bacterium]|jgi:Tfp pilus assembly protein PilO|nr:hypothetical protein [Solirubrobacteraceae bacterium]